MRRSRSLLAFAAAAATALVLAGCAGDDAAAPGDDEVVETGDLDALIAAAQEEGEVVFYLTPPEATGQALADAFFEEYDIEATFVRLTGGELSSRFSAEVEAGAPVADLVLPSYDQFIDEGLAAGWLTGLDEGGVPAFEDFPEEGKLDGGIAIVQFSPSALSWNTDALGDLPVPDSFDDLADPQYAGKLLLTDPTSSQAYIQFWTLIMDEYGLETVQAIADNRVRLYNSVVPMTEALAAGEGAATGPNVSAVVAGAAKNGAPVEFALPDLTTGPEIVMALTTEAAHPNAARLFANFVLSEKAQEIINGVPGNLSAFDYDQMPADYVRVDRDSALKNEEVILDAFGL